MSPRRRLLAIALACPLVWALASSVAEARPKSQPRAHHVAIPVLARQGEPAFASVSTPREPRGVGAVAAESPQNRMILASDEVVTGSAPVSPPGSDGPSPAVDVMAVPLAAAAVTLTFVDPAGGHPRVLPIETANPYHVR